MVRQCTIVVKKNNAATGNSDNFVKVTDDTDEEREKNGDPFKAKYWADMSA